jgi:hypothetical protein
MALGAAAAALLAAAALALAVGETRVKPGAEPTPAGLFSD